MIQAKDFLEICKKEGYTFFSGTPCSYLKPVINAVIDDPDLDYYDATNEGDAVAMVCGAHMVQRKGVVMFQNSGLGNAVNALTSLAHPFRFPFLMIVTHRGQPDGPADEPQHELMGQINENLLTALTIQWEYFPDEQAEIAPAMARALAYMEENKLPFAFLMRKGSVAAQELQAKKSEAPIGERTIEFRENLTRRFSERSSRTEALQAILETKREEDILIATTGKSGRELYTLEDVDAHFYMVGSMGSAASFALGAAINAPKNRFVVIDGDAAVLMRMGNLASVGAFQPKNYLHVLLDNEVNDSTGGQGTISAQVSFAGIALSCGYKNVFSTDDLEELKSILEKETTQSGPTFIHFRIRKGSPKDLGRPKVKPFAVKERMMQRLAK